MLIFVAKILWSTAHAPQNVYFGAPQKRFSLLVREDDGNSALTRCEDRIPATSAIAAPAEPAV
jgi:hypothetical protein